MTRTPDVCLTLCPTKTRHTLRPVLDALHYDGQEPEVAMMAFAEYVYQLRRNNFQPVAMTVWAEINTTYFYDMVLTEVLVKCFMELESTIRHILITINQRDNGHHGSYIHGYWELDCPSMVINGHELI